MKEINVDLVPELPMKDIICDECVAIGVVDSGVIIHYIGKDMAKIVEWEDIVLLGIANVNTVDKAPENIREIDSFTKE